MTISVSHWNKRSSAGGFALACVLFLVVSTLHGADFDMVKKLTVAEGDDYARNVVSLGGQVEINGNLARSIIMVGGSLTVRGTVEEDIVCLATRVDLGERARIKGELLVIGGTLTRADTSRVDGESFYFRFDMKKIESTVLPIISDARTITFLRIIKIVLWFILTLVVLALLPKRVQEADGILEHNLARVGISGILALCVFLFLLVLFIILSFLLIGIPFLLLLILLYFALLIFGRTVIFHFIGLRLTRLVKIKTMNPSLYLLAGVMVYAVLKFIPLLGPVTLFVLNICELGIAITYLLRKRLKPAADHR